MADVILPHALPTPVFTPPIPCHPPPPPPPASPPPLPPIRSPTPGEASPRQTHVHVQPIASAPSPTGLPPKLAKPSSPLLFQLALPITLSSSASSSRELFTLLSLDHPPNFPSHIGGGDDVLMETIEERAVGLLRSLVEPAASTAPPSAGGAQDGETTALRGKGSSGTLGMMGSGVGGDGLAGEEVWAGWAAELGDELEQRQHGSGDGYLWV